MTVASKPVSGSILRRGLSICQGLDAYWAMTEWAGGVLHNATGLHYDATVSGTPTWSSSPSGPALYFDGYDDYFDFGNVLAVHYNDVSMMAFVNLNTTQVETYAGIAGRGILSGSNKGAGLYSGSNKISWQSRSLNLAAGVSTAGAMNGTGWHVAIGVCDRDSATGHRLYVDGVLVATANPTAFASDDLYVATDRFVIGSKFNSYDFSIAGDFRGYIGAVAQWHRVLTPSEIAELSRDPFCVLRQRSLLMSAIAAMGSGTPATFKPAWAIRRRQAIGGGIL